MRLSGTNPKRVNVLNWPHVITDIFLFQALKQLTYTPMLNKVNHMFVLSTELMRVNLEKAQRSWAR